MRKPIQILLLFSLCAMLLPSVCKAGTPTEDKIVLSDLKYQSSSGLYYFDASLEGSRTYCAYNLDIYFPEGIDVASTTNGENVTYRVTMLKSNTAVYPYTTTYEYDDEDNEIEVKTYSHRVVCNMPQAHHLRIGCYSDSNQEFVKTSGVLFRVFVSLDLAASFSPKPLVTISGVALTQKENAAQFDPADYSCRPFTTGIPADRTLPINISGTNKVGTLILPFDAEIPQGIKAYTCTGAENETLTLQSANTFAACTPYIVYAENGYSGTISGTVDLTETYPATDVFTEGNLTGVLSTTVVNTGYILQNQGEGPMFYDAEGSSFSLPAGRCYFTPSTGGEVKAYRVIGDEAAGIQAPAAHRAAATYFDLSGRRVIHPTKGIYIQGEQKILLP